MEDFLSDMKEQYEKESLQEKQSIKRLNTDWEQKLHRFTETSNDQISVKTEEITRLKAKLNLSSTDASARLLSQEHANKEARVKLDVEIRNLAVELETSNRLLRQESAKNDELQLALQVRNYHSNKGVSYTQIVCSFLHFHFFLP